MHIPIMMNRQRVLFALLMTALFLLSGLSNAAHAQGRFQNIVNTRWATVSSGPQDTVIVDVPTKAEDSQARRLVRDAVRANWTAQATLLSTRQADELARAGLKKGMTARTGAFPISTLLVTRKAGRVVLPPLKRTRAFGGGTLTFTVKADGTDGFTSDIDRSVINDLVARFYPRIVEIYGQPGWSGNVEITNAGDLDHNALPETKRAAFGAYDVSNARILLPIFENTDSFAHALLLNMIHAFHGPAVFQYDAWEQGFARAAAAAVICRFNSDLGFQDATANFYYALLPFYDLLNQPALANPTFFPAAQQNLVLHGQFTIGKMLLPRLGMSGAAWLKVYIENPNFFKQFHDAYYAQFDASAQPSLAGNVPALRAIAGTVLPNGVEGQSWDNWYQQQYILDTSVSIGPKLYAFVLPGELQLTGDVNDGQSASITLVYFRGETNGDETLLNGTAYATYFDAENFPIPSLGPASEQAQIGQYGDGEGFLTTLAFPTPGFDAGKITMDFHVGNTAASTRSYLPSGFTGDFQLIALGPNATGNVTINQTTVIGATQARTQSRALDRSALGVSLGTGPLDLAVNVITLNNGGVTETYRSNGGFGQHYVVLRRGANGGALTSLQKVFDVSPFPRLISLPVRPLAASPDVALGLPASDFLLSAWDVTRAAYETVGTPGQPSVAPLETGRGYWLKLFPASGASQVALTVSGIAPPTDTDFTVPCGYGWNLIGTPFSTGFDVSSIRVQYLQNGVITWDEAVSRNLVDAQPWEYDSSFNTYTQVSSMTGADWRGYWLRVRVPNGVNLLLPAPDSLTSRAVRSNPLAYVGRSTAVTARPNWSVRLRAQTKTSDTGLPATASIATFGAAQGAGNGRDSRYDVEAPPALAPGVAIHFPHEDWGKTTGGRYVADFRGAGSAGSTTWNVAVDTPTDGPVTISWDGLGNVPRATNLVLIDKATGTRSVLRNRSAYTFTGSAGKTRSFQIVAEPARSIPLMITGITSSVSRAAGLSGLNVGYTVTDPDATVTVELTTMTGRLVRRLDGGRAETGSHRSVRWDGRSQEGSSVAPGVYRINITAQSAEGATTRQSQPVMLLR